MDISIPDFSDLFDRLFPCRCLVCETTCDPGRYLCDGCFRRLPRIDNACGRCALPLPVQAQGETLLCGRCLADPPTFDEAVSLFEYRDDAAMLIAQLKFHDRLVLSRIFGRLLFERVTERGRLDIDAVLPVPLHGRRLRQRGFNQSIELARTVCKRLGVPMLRREVVRVRNTGQQTGLDARQRRRNIRGAFDVVKPLAYRHVAIVDDVVTTGSTTDELARVLKRAGIGRVTVWSIARALV